MNINRVSQFVYFITYIWETFLHLKSEAGEIKALSLCSVSNIRSGVERIGITAFPSIHDGFQSVFLISVPSMVRGVGISGDVRSYSHFR